MPYSISCGRSEGKGQGKGSSIILTFQPFSVHHNIFSVSFGTIHKTIIDIFVFDSYEIKLSPLLYNANSQYDT